MSMKEVRKMKRVIVLLLAMIMVGNLVGCATSTQTQGAAAGTAVGAGVGALIGYGISGRDGALWGAAAGALVGGLTGWAIAKHREAVRYAAYQQRRVEYYNPNRTERIVAEPIEYRTINQPTVVNERVLVTQSGTPRVETRSKTLQPGRSYAKVNARSYKKNPQTNQEVVTSNTSEWVPLD
jgi:uncharacterized protein YcfJ